jgi:hypothetical protein
MGMVWTLVMPYRSSSLVNSRSSSAYAASL